MESLARRSFSAASIASARCLSARAAIEHLLVRGWGIFCSGGYLGFGLADKIFHAPLHNRLELVPIFREPSPSDNIEQLDASEFIAVKGMAEPSGQPIWRASLNSAENARKTMAPLINFGMVRGCWIVGTRCPGRVFVRRSIAKTCEIDRS
jgi:hypothetical protein